MRCKRIEVYSAAGTKIFIIIEARGKIIYHSLTSIIDVAPPCASNSFLIFHGNKSKSDFSSNAVNRATCNYSRSRMLHTYCTEIATQHAHRTLYHHSQIRIWIYIHTDIHLNISFIRTFDIVLCKWINIVDKHPEHDSEQYVDVSVDMVLFFCVVVCMLRHMRAFVYRQSLKGNKKKKKRGGREGK